MSVLFYGTVIALHCHPVCFCLASSPTFSPLYRFVMFGWPFS